jgi:FHA domain
VVDEPKLDQMLTDLRHYLGVLRGLAGTPRETLHARIVVKDGHATIEDLGSKNGTRVAGEKIRRPTPLVDGDEVRLGSIRMLFRVYAELFSRRTDPDSRG